MEVPTIDRIETRHGRVLLHDSGKLVAEARLTGDDWRFATAGDGLASSFTDAVLRGDPAALAVSTGYLSVVRPGSEHEESAAATAHVERDISVDMTNLSVIIDERYVVKLVGEWGTADRASRVLSTLSGADSAAIPPFIGHLDWIHPTRGRSTIALVSEFIPGATDGWTWAVDDVLAFVSGGPRPTWPTRLGELSAELHTTLIEQAGASQASAATGHAIRARSARVLDDALRVTHGAAGVQLRNRESALRRALMSVPDRPTGGVFDLHGDLHVGQILRAHAGAAEQYWAIDFDGDPQLDAADRDRADYAARDLAHLLASVELVGAVALRRLNGVSDAVLDWAAEARVELANAYRQRMDDAGYADRLDTRLLDAFVAEQLLRELIYANRYLPRWQYAADAVLTFRYPATSPVGQPHTAPEEDPWTPPVFTTT